MNAKTFISFLFLLSMLTGYSYPAVYYVAASGNDNNNGTSTSTPWKTITKVNAMMTSINPGDQILFKCGDTFSGTLIVSKAGTAGNLITFGSYGSGNKPILTGKKNITGWTLYSGNIYKATVTDTISQLYINNKLMTIARYPNSGFLKTDVGNGNIGFYDAALGQSNGYWSGANCRLRTINWSYEVKVVNTFGSGNITFTSPTTYAVGANYGYYFDNKLNLLDAQNEWYHDKATGQLYLYAPGGVNPNNLTVEAIVQKNVIYVSLHMDYLKFQNLQISGARDVGLDIYTADNEVVEGCYFNYTGLFGLRINGNENLVDGNTFEDNLNSAFTGVSTNSIIKNNIVNRTGLVAGYGASGWGYIAFEVNVCPGTIIEYNNIDSSGYTGISVAKNTIVRYNIIDYSCLVLNDGAGIDITDCDTLRVLNNIVSNTVGNFATSGIPNSYSCGIYVNGALMKNSTIQGNTCYNNAYYGILIDHKNTPVNNKVLDNVCYNNYYGQILFTDYSAVSYVPSYNTQVKGNVLYALSSNQNCMEQRTKNSATFADYGDFDSNYYLNPYTDYIIRMTNSYGVYNTTLYSLPSYQNIFNEDLTSNSSLFHFSQVGITDTIGGNMIPNPTFNNDLSTWITWPSGSTISWYNHPQLDSGSMKITWNGNGAPGSLSLSGRYSIVRGNYYLVSISVIGEHPGTFNMWGRSSYSPNFETFPQTYMSYDSFRKEHSFTYKADTTDPRAWVSVGLILPDSMIYVDNVKMYNINVSQIDSTQKSKLFINKNNYPTAISLNGIAYKDINGIPVTGGAITLQPYTSEVLINEDFIPSCILNIKNLIEGFYDQSANTMIKDTCRIYLRVNTPPYAIIDSSRVFLDSTGSGTLNFFNAVNNTNYYIVVKHRNSLETWSKYPKMFTNNYLNYDFSSSAAAAYGDNLKQMGSRFCVFSGEINNDGTIDVADIVGVYNSSLLLSQGYVLEDIDGDGFVDVTDINITYNNSLNQVTISRP